jgi:hypothetical protein
MLLDVLDIDDGSTDPARVNVGVHMLRTAIAATIPSGARPPEYIRFIPPGWRENVVTSQVVEARTAIAERTGARLFVEAPAPLTAPRNPDPSSKSTSNVPSGQGHRGTARPYDHSAGRNAGRSQSC